MENSPLLFLTGRLWLTFLQDTEKKSDDFKRDLVYGSSGAVFTATIVQLSVRLAFEKDRDTLRLASGVKSRKPIIYVWVKPVDNLAKFFLVWRHTPYKALVLRA